MEVENGEGQVQVQLKTKQEQYAVPEGPYAIEGGVKTADLNLLVNKLLSDSNTDILKTLEFDFLVFDEYLHGRLCDHLREKAISVEDVVEIEYVERFPAPEPQDCLLHDDWVSAVAVKGKFVLTGCYDTTVNIWTLKGDHIHTVNGHLMPVKSVAWISLEGNRGVFVSCSQDQTAMIWEWLIDDAVVNLIAVCKGHERGVDACGVSTDGLRFATGSWDTLLKIWSAEANEPANNISSKRAKQDAGATRVPLLTLQGHRESISAVQWIDSSTILTSSWDHTMKIWDLSLEGVKTEITANKSIFDASYSPLNRLIVTASADKNLRLYDSRTNQGSTVVRNTYLGHSQWVQTVMWAATEEYLFVSGSYDMQNKLWDYRSPKAPLYDLIGHGDKVLDIDWSNPKYIVSGGADNTVRIYKSRKAIKGN